MGIYIDGSALRSLAGIDGLRDVRGGGFFVECGLYEILGG